MRAWLPEYAAIASAWPWLLAVFVVAYLVGSIPFGLVITKAMGLGDVRKIGSGNIGTTNVLRTGSKAAAALTLLLDGGKGAAVVLIAIANFGILAGQIAAAGAFLGHLYPIYLRLKGGKGVATFLGIVLALYWPAGILTCLTWIITAVVFRFSSLAALVAALSTPIWLTVTGAEPTIWLGTLLLGLIFFKHRDNISRLLRGTEPKIGKSA
ncbi:glycerol-3-phosphate 1-O-acyltransferase PlsY [Roseobacter sp. HKCCA0434]|uniref:glycerol-3-phosphate 1-O-acyltransferase PlsY n=1 Tax=Roseobacter sp. HKCCA0434 TaxID=3079297 RepID=UPI002905C08E|nr:glycerol-3-phosphate 1-O-acyltransferase PlsY [Roseobacter sp. HKCCA0434]